MKPCTAEVEKIMAERFGQDTVIALATVENELPYVRYVNAYYENGAFYVITHALSNKMRQMQHHTMVAIAGEWFNAVSYTHLDVYKRQIKNKITMPHF